MKLLTAARAVAWIGAALVGWSLNLRWGDDVFLGAGPPATYHKNIVGALLLAFGAALAISISRRWPAKAIGVAGGVGCLAIALTVRVGAPDTVTSGTGWLWLAAGAAAAAIGTITAALIKPPDRAEKRRRR